MFYEVVGRVSCLENGGKIYKEYNTLVIKLCKTKQEAMKLAKKLNGYQKLPNKWIKKMAKKNRLPECCSNSIVTYRIDKVKKCESN